MEVLERSFAAALGDERTISGVAMPWNKIAKFTDGSQEMFVRDAFQNLDDLPPLTWEHGEVIGRITKAWQSERGLEIEAKLSTTPRADDAYTLLRDGSLNKFSVAFLPLDVGYDDDVAMIRSAELRAIGLVGSPAYKDASVFKVRSDDAAETAANTTEKEETDMEKTERDELLAKLDAQSTEIAETRSLAEETNRKVSVLSAGPAEPAPAMFRSAGEWIKGLYRSDDKAHELYRLFSGATTADSVVRDAWVADAIVQVAQNRPVVGAFSRTALPATGMQVEYAVLEGTTGTVEQQDAEGDDLTYTEVQLGTDTAPVITLGAYASLSRQTIDRSDVNVLNESYEFMLNEYARQTDAYVLAALEAGTYSSVGALPTTNKTAWLTWLVNAAAEIKSSSGMRLEVLVVSTDVFIDLITLDDSAGGSFLTFNTGSANPLGLSATLLGGVEVVVVENADDNTCYGAARNAMRFYESGNAPVRLQDANIINLTQDVSIHGLCAVAVRVPDAIVSHDAEASG